LEAFRGPLGGLGRFLDASWTSLGRSWVPLGTSRVDFRPSGVDFGRFLGGSELGWERFLDRFRHAFCVQLLDPSAVQTC